MSAYYNEIEPYAAAWLRNLIAAGHLPAGDVDDRSIEDVRPDELAGYDQCHFFAGIGGWPYALRLAGWQDEWPVWTGSCPCQPFSIASCAHGGAQGQRDHRDLWPVFAALIRERRPATVFGEQVAGAIQWGWWDRAAMDLEGEGYAVASAVLRADACGADHQRRRLFWLADTGGEGRQRHQPERRISVAVQKGSSELGDPFARARCALAGDYSDLLPCDGLPVSVERLRAKGYGNAIVPQSGAAFVAAYMDAMGVAA